MRRFVLNNIGLAAITREQYIERHVTDFANRLYNPTPENRMAIFYIDGTYTYCFKSKNFRSLRQTYCRHKSDHLVKPALVVAPDGYILDIQGPYFSDAHNNDAAMISHELENDENLNNWFRPGDIVVVDRGYRDVIPALEELGLICKMPPLLKAGEQQLTTEDANEARLVTKTRWIVESRNGHLKTIFKLLNQVQQIHVLPHIGDFIRIGGAIINRYRQTIEMEDADEEMAEEMLECSTTENAVQARVEAEGLLQRDAQRWVRLSAEQVIDFPELNIEYLKRLTAGVFQIKLAPSYIQDTLQRNNEQEIQVEMLRDANRIPELGFLRIYKKYSQKDDYLKNKYNFSYTFNTDGCQAADNSKVSVWPIYILIHELPDFLRKKFTLLVGLWVAKEEPDMNIFLEPFVKQANMLSNDGFTWRLDDKIITSKLFPLGCCVDSVARCAMLNMKRFNGFYGCTYCEHPAVNVSGVRKYPMIDNVPELRTNEKVKEQMIAAASTKDDVLGVWGPSSLMNLNHFDLVQGMVVDFLHACLVGVTELYTEIIMTNTKQEFYVGSPAKTFIIDQRLLSFKPPTCIAKTQKSISEHSNWKASEWLIWLLYYSLPCLEGLYPKEYSNHLALFVRAMNILLEDSITPEMLKTSSELLIKFVYYFGQYFDNEYMHYNVHLLLPLTKSVKNWGPLWAINFVSKPVLEFCTELNSQRLKKRVRLEIVYY
uniref:DDE Tnp4 domain-containing protein n=1 Tax=Trichogramma kaykai TaxID=54128 RepID=A0ABD2WMH4_9HYME